MSSSSPARLSDENIRSAVSLWFQDRSGCVALYGHVKDWDVSAVTNMSDLFEDRNDFNGDVSQWDVSNVKDMNSMFNNAFSFNGDVSQWQVGNVTNMALMFATAESSNQDVGGWDVSKVTNMAGMFNGAGIFNQDVGGWDVSSVEDMNYMFSYVEAFNQDISNWDVRKVKRMDNMFYSASSFCQDISGWDVSNLSKMEGMFDSATALQSVFSRLTISSLFDEKFRSMPFSERQDALGLSVTGGSVFTSSVVVVSSSPQHEQSQKKEQENVQKLKQQQQQSRKENKSEGGQINPNSLFAWLESDVFSDIPRLVEPVFTKFKEQEYCESLEDLLKNCGAYSWTYFHEEMKLRPVVATRLVEALEKLQEGELLKKEKHSAKQQMPVSDEQVPVATENGGHVKYIRRSTVMRGRRVGGGGFGEVFEATYDFKRVALKCFGSSGLLTEKSMREVRHEVGVMSRLDHPALVRLLGFVCEEREGSELPPMLVMEYGTHGSLYAYLNSDKELSVGQRLRMSAGLAGGLSYLHKKKVVHSDIKSLNMVLGDHLVAKWCDFGLSSLKEHSTATMSKVVSGSGSGSRSVSSSSVSMSTALSPKGGVGTLRWMSPELFVVLSLTPTFRSDMWAFGMVLFELVTREVPFAKAVHDEQVKECIRQWDGTCVPGNCRADSGLSVLGEVMGRCWARQPTERPSAEEVELELARVLSEAETNESKGDHPSVPLQSGVVMNESATTALPPPPSASTKRFH